MSGTATPDQWLIDWVRQRTSDSGIDVNGDTCLTYATVWQAVNVIAGDLAQLPLNVYRRVSDQDRQRDMDHAGGKLLRRRPNGIMAPFAFKLTLQAHALLWGNGFAEIERDGSGRPLSLTPLRPDKTSVVVIAGDLFYVTKIAPADKERVIPAADIFHVRGLGFDGLVGYSVIDLARNSWGLGLALEKHGNQHFKNQATPQGVLKHPGRLTADAAQRLRQNWERIHKGLDNAGRIAVLEEGLEFSPMSMSNENAQWLEGRKHQRTEVASWFNLPPYKVGDLERATFSNIEEQKQDYLSMSLMRWLVTWQDECNAKLLMEKEKESESHYFEFNTDAFLRGNKLARTQSQVQQFLNGQLTLNEWRAQENMNGIGPEGDVRFVPLNMTTLAKAIAEPEPIEEPEEAGAEGLERALAHYATIAAAKESDRVCHAAMQWQKNPSKHNFLAWLDTFYTATWPDQLRDIVGPVLEMSGGNVAEIVATHCRIAKERLLDAAGYSYETDLADNVAAAMARPNWTDSLTRKIGATQNA